MKPFWEQPLSTLDRAQWEALCDGCGKCCLHKIEGLCCKHGARPRGVTQLGD